MYISRFCPLSGRKFFPILRHRNNFRKVRGATRQCHQHCGMRWPDVRQGYGPWTLLHSDPCGSRVDHHDPRWINKRNARVGNTRITSTSCFNNILLLPIAVSDLIRPSGLARILRGEGGIRNETFFQMSRNRKNFRPPTVDPSDPSPPPKAKPKPKIPNSNLATNAPAASTHLSICCGESGC